MSKRYLSQRWYLPCAKYPLLDRYISWPNIARYCWSILFLLLANQFTFAQTEISGEKVGVLKKSESPYLISGEVTVPQGKTLTIEPGVEIRFLYGYDRIQVNGTLIANGAILDSIKFIGVQTNSNNIKTYGGSINFSSSSQNSELNYISMNYMGYAYADPKAGALKIASSSLMLKNYTINNAERNAIYID